MTKSMNQTARTSSAVMLFVLGAVSARAQATLNTEALAERADSFLRGALSSTRIPSVAVCVMRDGKVELAKGYGLANVELSVPASEHTLYELASLTKPFTALAVMMLVEEGKISLEDRLPKYFPNAPASWSNISVEQLLRHTSGLGDFFAIPELRFASRFAWEREYSPQDLLPILYRTPILSPPGERWSYSNVGYYLLGLIIEHVSGDTYEAFLKRRVFDPLGMTETRRMDRKAIIPQRAAGYTWDGKTLHNAEYTSTTWAFSEGGLASSVADLAKVEAGLFGEKLLKRETVERMWQPSRLNDGTFANYGLGWNIGSDARLRQVYHSGNKPGFAAIIRHYPDDSLTVVLLTNVDNGSEAGADVGALSFRVAEIFRRGGGQNPAVRGTHAP